MKRILVSLMMASGLTMLMAPMAHAVAPIECGKSYAITINGTEPLLTNDDPNHYIAGIGQITFAAAVAPATSCTVSHLEMLYNDNDILTFWAGPTGCYTTQGLGGLPGVPCFDGADHQATPGSLSFSPLGNGAAQLTIDPSFTWISEQFPTTGDLPLTFTLQASTGGATVLGNVVADTNGPSNPPPASPVLVITMQKQSTTAVVPVTTGPMKTSCGMFGCTGGGQNGYGIAPYLGASISLFQGFGAPSADPFAQPIDGSFGSTISALQIFTTGLAGGSASFSTNDNVGNTGFTGDFSTNSDCDTAVVQTGNFGDAASNDAAQIIHPGPHCTDATNGGAGFTLSAVQWGATDTSEYVQVTGLESNSLTGGKLISVGLMSNAQGLGTTAGKLTSSATATQTLTNSMAGIPVTKAIKLTSTTPAPCDVVVHLTGTLSDAHCALSLSGGSQTVEGDTVNSGAVLSCVCDAVEDDPGLTGSVTVTSTNCPVSLGAGPVNATCTN